MIVEGIGLGLAGLLLYRNAKDDYYKYKGLIEELPNKNKSFSNANGNKIRFINYKDNVIRIDIAGICGSDAVESQKEFLKSYFRVKDIEFIDNLNGKVDLKLIDNSKFEKNFEIVPQKPYELLTGYKDYKPNLINMNRFPHLLVGGDTGSGKSKFLMMLLSNLIANCPDVDLYLMQIRKSDLIVFKDCKQCKYIARDLTKARNLLKHINDMCIERDSIIEQYTVSKGIYNIEDYNRYFKNKKMNYAYLVLEEFSFFTPNGADSKEEKKLKQEILGYIKQIVNSSRSAGVFIITSLQKPTNSSIPTDIKNQLCTRVAFKLSDKETSIVILGNATATKLNPLEAIIRTNNQTIVNIPLIHHKSIINAIRDDIDSNEHYIKLVDIEETNNEGVIE